MAFDHADAAQLLHARDLKYRDFLTVVLIGKSRSNCPTIGSTSTIPTYQVGRVQNFRSWSPEMIPDGVSTCLGLEYFCFGAMASGRRTMPISSRWRRRRSRRSA